MTTPDCLFCRVAAGDVPATVRHSGPDVLAFDDINPQAPVHVLVIPREHISSLDDAVEGHRLLLGDLLLAARDVARERGLAEGGYRTVINTGADGGQSVHHIHVHVLGGRALSWPPG